MDKPLLITSKSQPDYVDNVDYIGDVSRLLISGAFLGEIDGVNIHLDQEGQWEYIPHQLSKVRLKGCLGYKTAINCSTLILYEKTKTGESLKGSIKESLGEQL